MISKKVQHILKTGSKLLDIELNIQRKLILLIEQKHYEIIQ